MNKYIYHKPLVNILNNDNLNNDTRNVPQLYLIFHDILFKFLKSKPVNYNNKKLGVHYQAIFGARLFWNLT